MAKKGKEAAKKSASSDDSLSVAGTPQAAASVERIRARGGLLGLLFGLAVGLASGGGWFHAGLWALISGIVCSLMAWWWGILLWQAALPAEARARQRETWEAYREELARRKLQDDDE